MNLLRRTLATLAVAGVVATLVLMATRFDLIRVTEPLDPTETSAGGGLAYRNPIPTLYAPFFTVAPPEAAALQVLISGAWHRCTADAPQVARHGSGRCAFGNTYLTWSRPDNADPRVAQEPTFVRYPVRATPELLIAVLALPVIFGLGAAFATTARRAVAVVGVIPLVPGALLMGANLVGLFMPLRSPTLTEMQSNYGPGDLRYSYEEAAQLLEWRADDTPLSFANRANDAIAGSVLHFWTESRFREFRIVVPAWENWLIRLLGQVDPAFAEYIFWDPWKTIERGVGTCGHVSSALVGILRERRIDARMVTLFGHVVVTAEIGSGVWHIFDPDLGIVIPYDLPTLQKREDLLREAYGPVIRSFPLEPDILAAFEDMLVNAYLDRATNHIDPLGRESYHSGLRAFGLWHSALEPHLYRMKWLVPAGLMLLGGVIVAAASCWPRRADARRTPTLAGTHTASGMTTP